MSEPSRLSDEGFHTPLIKKRLPDWVKHLAPHHIAAITRARDPAQTFKANHPSLFAQAKPELRQALLKSQARSQASHHALAKTLKDFKGITEFATPLLMDAMRSQYRITPDVNKTLLFHMRAPNSHDAQTLLQAALRNFVADESFDEVALQESSALAPVGSLETHYYGEPVDQRGTRLAKYVIRNKLPVKPASYASLCRELDLGQQYQSHLSFVFDRPGTAAQVREQMIVANKDTLRVQTHIAHMQSHIDQAAYATLLAIVNGHSEPRLDGRKVTYSRLRLLGSELGEILIVGAASRNADTTWFDTANELSPGIRLFAQSPPDTRIIVYIPGDPLSPVKEHASLKAFAKDLSVKLRSAAYQRFFAGFVPQAEAATFFRRLKSQLKTYRWNPKPNLPKPYYNVPGGIYEEIWNEDVDLQPDETFFGTDVFGERYELYVARLKADARLLAVPVTEVDHQAWVERLAHYAEWGLNVLNVAAFFVPGLGELMLAVTAIQLTQEIYCGIEAWEIGDAEEAWGHLQSVLLNVAFMAAVGVATSLPKLVGSEMVNGLVRVKLPNGDIKLWKPDLGPYQSEETLEGLKPNALGQYELGGKTYIRQESKVYEQFLDPELKKWRIKHPTDPQAYQPVLQHNHLGAWRHAFEQPLAWDRATLLRRMGHATDAFSDLELAQIADISGVSDDALRKMHLDHQAPPALLADTLKQFRIDRDINQMIGQVRVGEPTVDNRYNYVLPTMVDMPRWPLGRVIEVFEGDELTGTSTLLGRRSGVIKPSIRVTKAQVSSSRLPSIILAALDEQEIEQLLGAEGARVVSNRLVVFRGQIADYLQTKTGAVFESIYKGTEPALPGLNVLRRHFPSLPVEAAQELLNTLSEAERLRLSETRRVPLSVLERARGFVQQARLNRAYAGLQLDSLATTDSDRLALHALKKLPGWSHQIRLEVRVGHVKGRLLDSIGNETAVEHKYLVRQGQQFQAYDAQGNALNSVPRHGRNVFASIMHALPDNARSDLGLPHVSQSPALQSRVIRYAVGERDEMSRVLGQQPIKPRFRTPQKGYSAYLLSGRGEVGMVPSLVARVRDLYPNLTDEIAEQFVRHQLLGGRTPQQVFDALSNLARELQGLQATLEQWVAGEEAPAIVWRVSRRVLADRLIESWRSRPYRSHPGYSHLNLSGAGQLPPLIADFSHITSLGLSSAELTGPAGEAIFRQFRSVRRIDMWLEGGSALPEAVIRNTAITELRLNVRSLNQGLQQQLNTMVQLQILAVSGELGSIDVSHLRQLRHLNLVGAQLHRWPVGALELEHLESLDLRANSIRTLPEQLLSGHERLWRGLSMDWEALDHETFMSVYGYLRGNAAHLADAEHVAEAYRTGCLRELFRDSVSSVRAREEGIGTEAMLEQIKVLRQESYVLMQRLDEWRQRVVRVDRQLANTHYREVIAKRLMTCWRDGVRARYGETGLQALRERLDEVLDLSGWGLGDLPELPGTGYDHVRHLNLAGTKVPELETNAFLRKFPQLRQLNLIGNGFTELPSAVEELAHLTALNASGNEFRSTPALQARLNRLTSLEVLELRNNPLEALDVSAMTRLKILDLSATALREWPAGVWDLPQLRTMYLNRSRLTSIPDVALHGHDQLVATTGLSGCLLTEEAFARRQGVVERYYASIGQSPAVALDRSQWGMPQYFAPIESAESIASSRLPVLPVQTAGRVMSPVSRLRELDPGMGETEASQIVERLLEQGVGPLEIDSRISVWRQEHDALTSTLNEWISISGYNVANVRVTAVNRRRAADAILGSWRQEIRTRTSLQVPAAGGVLDLGDMPLGDLPALPRIFAEVRTLNLRDVKLSEQGSNAFLNAFPNLDRLVLDNNELDLLPEAVTGMHNLTRLEAGGNFLSMSEGLQRQLNSLTSLEWLDLRENHLNELDVQALLRLRTLDLRNNGFVDWPSGVLQSRTLRTLNLAGNSFSRVSAEDFQSNDVLMRGTDLSGNYLSREEFATIRDYFERSGNSLGYTAEELDALIGSSSEESSSSDDEVDEETQEEQRTRWIAGTLGSSVEKQSIWNVLHEQEDSRNFFHLLSQLKHSKDFTQNRADLTRRVWQVLEAANGDEALRKELFLLAETGYTCGDGRILAFSDLEVKVFEFNALRSASMGQEGRELLKLSQGLFRLGEVERVANESIKRRPEIDPAEVRLAYRIGLAQRLELPGQPTDMLYRNLSRVSPDDINAAYNDVIAAEQTPEFMTQLVGREYWVNYLKRKYPADFAQVQRRREVQIELLEEQYSSFNEAYFGAVTALDAEIRAEELQLALDLSQRERAEIVL